MCVWWQPKRDEPRLSALSAPKATAGYSPTLKTQEPSRFLAPGSEVLLLDPFSIKRYKAWRIKVGDRADFFAYEAELMRFSEVPQPPTTVVGGDRPELLERIAGAMSERGVPTDGPTVSRAMSKFRKMFAAAAATEHFKRPLSDDDLKARLRLPEVKELIDEAVLEMIAKHKK